MLPFKTGEFFDVFARYNAAIWPAQIGAAALGVLAVILLFRSGPVASRAICLILAAFWLLMGIGYHLLFFTRINTLAYAFGLLFVAQAALLFVNGVIRRQIMFRAEPGWRARLAWCLIAYGLVIYPLIGLFGSHPYPMTPLFGVAGGVRRPSSLWACSSSAMPAGACWSSLSCGALSAAAPPCCSPCLRTTG